MCNALSIALETYTMYRLFCSTDKTPMASIDFTPYRFFETSQLST